MANKLRARVENLIRYYNEKHYSYEDLKTEYYKLLDLVYNMWSEELISDTQKDGCYEVISDFGRFLLKELHKNS